MKNRGFTLIELLITIAIIGILAAIAVPSYVGQQKRASRTEAYTNLETIRLLEEQRFADRGTYVGAGTCGADQDNILAIQNINVLPRFQPGASLQYSYCIENNVDLDGNATSCYRARAFGNSGTRVANDPVWQVDCNNRRNF